MVNACDLENALENIVKKVSVLCFFKLHKLPFNTLKSGQKS
jgi:hypothetical protein